MALAVTAVGAVALTVSDGVVNATVETDPACTARLAAAADTEHFVGVVADAGPLLASFVVDGTTDDDPTVPSQKPAVLQPTAKRHDVFGGRVHMH